MVLHSLKIYSTTIISVARRRCAHVLASVFLIAGLVPLPALAIDPTQVFPAQQTLIIAGCQFNLINSYIDVPGPANDQFQSGISVIIASTGMPAGHVGGVIYSGTSISGPLSVTAFRFASVCDTNTSRIGSHSFNRPYAPYYDSSPGYAYTAQQLTNDGSVDNHLIEVNDTVPSTFVVPIDYDPSLPMWQGTTVTISSTPAPYHHPVADAGADQSVPPGATVTLDGTGTYDLDGDLSTASWSQTAGPTVTLDTTSPFQPTFVAPASSTRYSVTFRIVPRDAAGRTPHSGFTYPAGTDDTVTILIDPALDTEAPVISPPADISVNAGAVTNSAVVNFVATVGDNVDTPDRFTPVYTFEGNVITSPYDFPAGIHTVTVTANADSSGNEPTPVDFQVEVVDVSPPTLTINGVPGTIMSVDPFMVNFDFSEDVVGFDVTDIQVTGASISEFQGSGASYSIVATPSGTGNISITVADGAATDIAGNLLVGAGAVSTFETLERTSEVISNAMMRRATNLLANQPDLLPLLRGDAQGGFNLFATKGQLDFDLSYSDDNTWWFQLRGSRSDIAGAESQYVLGTIGAHMRLSDDFLLGAMLEVDDFRDRDGVATVSGTGWLVGPYFVARLPQQPLYFDGRLLFGQSENTISPFGSYTDKFSTERVLATLRMTGEIDLEPVSLMPFFSLQHTSDRQLAYVDSIGTPIPSHSIGLTEVEMGLDWTYSFAINEAKWEFTGGLSGVFADATQSGPLVDISATTPDYRSRLDLGLQFEPSEQHILTLDMSVDGIGVKDFSSYSIGFSYQYDF